MKTSLVMWSLLVAASCSNKNSPKNAVAPDFVNQVGGQTVTKNVTQADLVASSASQEFVVKTGPLEWKGFVQDGTITLKDLPTEFQVELAESQSKAEVPESFRKTNWQQRCTQAIEAGEELSETIGSVELRLRSYPRDSEVLEVIRSEVRKQLNAPDLKIITPGFPKTRNLNYDSASLSNQTEKLKKNFENWSNRGSSLAVLAYHGSALSYVNLGMLCDVVLSNLSMNVEW